MRWRDPRVLAIAAAALAIVIGAAVFVSGRAPSTRPSAEPSPAPALATVSPAPYVEGAPTIGTAKPVATSAGVPSPPPAATPTPTPDPAVWRFEGRVVDASGATLPRVCVIIGPLPCQTYGPHTDDRGVYFIDLPQVATVVYELRFEKEGYDTVYYRAQPSGPAVFNVVLGSK